jgi:YegS/Rv2252/BmrU family lipid kinase
MNILNLKKLITAFIYFIFFATSFNIMLATENTKFMENSTNKKRIRFIINPKSGTKKKKRILDLINIYLDKNKYDYEIKYTNAPFHATTLAKEVSDSCDIVVAIGGDGTVNEVAKGLINSKAHLAIIPMGSGNGYARNLKIPMNSKKAIKLINKFNSKTVDIASINDTYFLGIAGIGFDAEIADKFAKAKKRGFLTYAKVVLKELKTYKEKSFEMIIDDEKTLKKGFLISFAKSSQYGNNINISPLAKVDDGNIYLTILKKPPVYNLINTFYKILTKKIHTSKHLETIKCKTIKILEKNIIAHIDGEPILFDKGIDMKIIPKSLKILIN